MTHSTEWVSVHFRHIRGAPGGIVPSAPSSSGRTVRRLSVAAKSTRCRDKASRHKADHIDGEGGRARTEALGLRSAVRLVWRLTKGKVRARVRRAARIETGRLDCMALETDAPTNKGDSEGPTLNDRGELVGVVSHPGPASSR